MEAAAEKDQPGLSSASGDAVPTLSGNAASSTGAADPITGHRTTLSTNSSNSTNFAIAPAQTPRTTSSGSGLDGRESAGGVASPRGSSGGSGSGAGVGVASLGSAGSLPHPSLLVSSGSQYSSGDRGTRMLGPHAHSSPFGAPFSNAPSPLPHPSTLQANYGSAGSSNPALFGRAASIALPSVYGLSSFATSPGGASLVPSNAAAMLSGNRASFSGVPSANEAAVAAAYLLATSTPSRCATSADPLCGRRGGFEGAGVPVSSATSGPLSASDPRTQLFVGNLPYRVRWQDLKDLFRRSGTVLRADVALTPDNRSKGHGTVLLATEEDARRAVEMFNGFTWQGRVLEVRIDRSGTLLGGVYAAGPGGNAATGQFLGLPHEVVTSRPCGVASVGEDNASLLAAQQPGYSFSSSTFQQQQRSLGGDLLSTASSSMQHLQRSTSGTPLPHHQASGGSSAAGMSPALIPFFAASASGASPDHQGGVHGVLPYSDVHILGVAGTRGGGGSPYLANALPAGNGSMDGASTATSSAAAAGGQGGLHQPTSYYGRVLFVGNLPFQCQWQDLKDLFRAAGDIQRADVAVGPEGRSRGFGTVLFATAEDAQNAVRIYHGYEYNGRTLKVHFDRFAQNVVPPPGSLPATPSQYTGAFSAAQASSNVAAPTVAGIALPNAAAAGGASPYMMMRLGQHSQQPHQHVHPQYQQYPSQQSYLRQGYTAQQQYMDTIARNNLLLSAAASQGSSHAYNAYNGPSWGQLPGGSSGENALSGPAEVPASFNGAAYDGDLLRSSAIGTGSNESVSAGASASASVVSSTGAGEVRQASHPAHPGRIDLPPLGFHPSASFSAFSPGVTMTMLGIPMTPGMPGFTFENIPQTPPTRFGAPLPLLSPGVGAFSPPVGGVAHLIPGGPVTPGGQPLKPYMNPAPGAPVHMQHSHAHQHQHPGTPSAHLAFYMPTPHGEMPPTPHWSRPPPPPPHQQQLQRQRQEQQSKEKEQEQQEQKQQLQVQDKEQVAQADGEEQDVAADAPGAVDWGNAGATPAGGDGSVLVTDSSTAGSVTEAAAAASQPAYEGYPFPVVPLSAGIHKDATPSALAQRRTSTNSLTVSVMIDGLTQRSDALPGKSSTSEGNGGSGSTGANALLGSKGLGRLAGIHASNSADERRSLLSSDILLGGSGSVEGVAPPSPATTKELTKKIAQMSVMGVALAKMDGSAAAAGLIPRRSINGAGGAALHVQRNDRGSDGGGAGGCDSA
ncbi:hypothetical protein K437DRAFT_237507 [Tilletiaria anomala UBC 951]|uniref:RRM domain-containing protein n=1 Tax=Tilletiaria anomala (strain ATCC 24038 / CBS 436.72 / UBC 951) TaxID=1037660 RepID=A0A066VVP3_TILAU|nr:uncharacterized protein K437DRAFT_237507 [Tilletiaria anomala UBC 951]KDN42849.1 hypothetical protein K437DRAFT_237507 [Tilletiaria anomala UBC 951]